MVIRIIILKIIMHPILPKNLVDKSIDLLGTEMTTDNFNETRNIIWNKIQSEFNSSSYKSRELFITGRVTGTPKFLRNGAIFFQITNTVGNKINIYSQSKSALTNNIHINSLVGIKGKYQLYRNSKFNEDCTVQFLANEITNLKMIREDIKPLKDFIDTHKLKKRIKYLGKKKIRIALITSENSEAREDIKRGIGKFYEVHEYFVNLYNCEEIAERIRQLNESEYDLILISRGGTEKLEVFNNYDIINELFQSSKIVITALGHASFKSLSDLVADYSFDTPSAAAIILSNMRKDYEQKRKYIILGAILLGIFTYLLTVAIK